MNDAISKVERDDWPIFCSILEPHNVVLNDLEKIKTFLSPPSNLISFAIVAKNLEFILEKFETIIFESSSRVPVPFDILSLIKLCKFIFSIREKIESKIPGFSKDGKNHFTPPLHGKYQTNPLYVALWCRVKDTSLTDQYILLQAYLCVAHYYSSLFSDTEQILGKNAREQACLASRKLADPLNDSKLRQFPTSPVSFEHYRELIDPLVKNPESDFHYIGRFFDIAIERKKAYAKKATGKHNTYNEKESYPITEEVPPIEFNEDDGTEGSETIKVLNFPGVDRQILEEQVLSLCSPLEFNSKTSIVVVENTGPDPSGGRSSYQQYIQAKIVSSVNTMKNQRLAIAWDRLNVYEINTFLNELFGLAYRQKGDIETIPCSELAAFLAIMFWTSSRPETVQKCQILPGISSYGDGLGILWGSCPPCYWVVNPKVPVQKIVSGAALKRQALQHVARYTLSIPRLAELVMLKHLSQFKLVHENIQIFRRDIKEYELAADKFFSVLRKNSGGRQNLLRIALHMHNKIAGMPGMDATVAMSITGRSDPLGDVPIFYTAISADVLTRCYELACSEIKADLGVSVEEASNVYKTIGGSHVGSKYVPQETSVRNLIREIRARLETARVKIKNGGGSVPELHNDITFYTVLLIGFATGYRSIRDPLLQKAEMDRSTGFGVISDKDGDDLYHSRIIWLPELCFKQLDNYQEHLSHLEDWLFAHNQNLFFASRRDDVVGRQICRETPSLFFIKKDLSALDIMPNQMKKLMKRLDYYLPVNANRHYLRSNLLKRKCPIEVINAFMGHWIPGVEPWGMYSGMSPLDYRRKLRPNLLKMLKVDGWGLEKGLSGDIWRK